MKWTLRCPKLSHRLGIPAKKKTIHNTLKNKLGVDFCVVLDDFIEMRYIKLKEKFRIDKWVRVTKQDWIMSTEEINGKQTNWYWFKVSKIQ